MKQVYLIPAPDMDERAIESMILDGVEFVRVNLPQLTHESNLNDVTDQLAKQIANKNPLILGFCYGGVLAIELAKKISAEKIIVVSGVKSSQDIAPSRKIMAYAFYFMPDIVLRGIGMQLTFWINTVLRLDVKIPRIWLKSGQNRFIIRHALRFDCQGVTCEIIRVHGSHDKVVPLSITGADIVIEDAGHFMFVHRRNDVLKAIAEAIG